MRKVFAITLASVCALSVAAFTACDGDEENGGDGTALTSEAIEEEYKSLVGEKVTEAEWRAAMDVSNAYNITMTGYGYETGVSVYDGITDEYECIDLLSVKLDLEVNESDNITGSVHYYESEQDSGIYDGENYSVGFEEEEYGNMEYATSRYSENYNGVYEEEWRSMLIEDAGDFYYEEYNFVAGWLSFYAEDYDEFEYSEEYGAYILVDTYSSEEDDEFYGYDTDYYAYTSTCYIKINDGHLSSIASTGTVKSDTNQYEEDKIILFTGYGTTTVTIPEEYTYSYYLEHYAE